MPEEKIPVAQKAKKSVPQQALSVEEPKSKKLVRRTSRSISSPSITNALQGKFEDDKLTTKEQFEMFSKEDEKETFTVEELVETWNKFVDKLDERPNLKSTLSVVPELKENFVLYLEIENTVQEGLINSIKPELVSFLRKELKNSLISLSTEITEKVRGRVIYSDNEKYEEMVRKNPSLALLRKEFNLDFGQ